MWMHLTRALPDVSVTPVADEVGGQVQRDRSGQDQDRTLLVPGTQNAAWRDCPQWTSPGAPPSAAVERDGFVCAAERAEVIATTDKPLELGHHRRRVPLPAPIG